MTALSRMDDILLKKMQQFSEHQQVETGRNCYYLAYEFYLLEQICGVYLPAILAVPIAVFESAFLGMFLLVVIALFWPLRRQRGEMMRIIKYQKKKLPEPPKELRISTLVRVLLLTAFCLWFIVYVSESSVLMAGLAMLLLLDNIFFVVIIYLVSCTPLPPEQLQWRRQRLASYRKSGILKPQAT